MKIQSLYHRLKVFKEFKDLRKQLKGMPFVIRSSCVKMHWLKRDTGSLIFDSKTMVKKS